MVFVCSWCSVFSNELLNLTVLRIKSYFVVSLSYLFITAGMRSSVMVLGVEIGEHPLMR